jgi:spermidine synthase
MKPGKPLKNRVPNTSASASTEEPRFGFRLPLWLLFATAFLNGSLILALEILGVKWLAPYFGLSHFVWTAQITVTLLALAAGYELGGWLSNRGWDLGRFFLGMALAGCYLAGLLHFGPALLLRCLRLNLPAGSLIASGVSFFIPLMILAGSVPFLIRRISRKLDGAGKAMGNLWAISTLGSAAGAWLAGYVWVPHFSNEQMLAIVAGTLAGWALLAIILSAAKGWAPALAVAVTALAACALIWSAPGPAPREATTVLATTNSYFGTLEVLQSRTAARRLFLNDLLVVCEYDTEHRRSLSMYTYVLDSLAHCYQPELQDALCIGLGIGIVPMNLAREGKQVDVVEINPAVPPLAERFFDFDPSRVHLALNDGRYILNRTGKKYDLALLDAYLGDATPAHLFTREAFAQIRRALRPKGVLVLSTAGNLGFSGQKYVASVQRTLSSVFDSVRMFDSRVGSIFFVASAAPLEFRDWPKMDGFPEAIQKQVRRTLANPYPHSLEGGVLLTDDFNPVEILDAPNRERLRRGIAMHALTF